MHGNLGINKHSYTSLEKVGSIDPWPHAFISVLNRQVIQNVKLNSQNPDPVLPQSMHLSQCKNVKLGAAAITVKSFIKNAIR